MIVLSLVPCLNRTLISLDPVNSSTVRPRRVLLLLAHPDDEVMFFSPLLHSLLSSDDSGIQTELWAACMSAGPPLQEDERGAQGGALFFPPSSSSSLLNTSSSFALSSQVPLRARELLQAYAHFNMISSERILVFSDPHLVDGLKEVWAEERVRDVLLSGLQERFMQLEVKQQQHRRQEEEQKQEQGQGQGQGRFGTWDFDWLITFDEQGISGHANHRALRKAAPLIVEALASRSTRQGDGRRPRLWVLPTLPLPFKYGSLPFALAQRLFSLFVSPSWRPSSSDHACQVILSSPSQYLTSLQAMRQGHASQMVWYRYAWWVMSSHVFGGKVCRVESSKIE